MIDLLVEKIQRNKRKLDRFLLYCDPLAYCSLSNVTSTEFEFSYKVNGACLFMEMHFCISDHPLCHIITVTVSLYSRK